MPIRIFNNYVPRQVFYLALIEALIVSATVYLGVYIRFGAVDTAVDGFGPMWPRAVLVMLVVMMIMVAMGLYHGRLRTRLTGMALRTFVSFSAAGAVLALLFYILPDLYLGRGVMAITMALGLTGILLVRLMFFHMVDETVFKRRVLVYGTGKKALNIVRLRRRSDQRGFTVIGFLSGNESEEKLVEDDRVIQVNNSLAQFALQNNVDEIVVAIDDRRKGLRVQELLDCKLGGIEVTDAASFFERETGKVKLDLLYPSWLIFSDGFVRRPLRMVTGRVFDVVVAIIILALTWPIMLIAAICIWLEDGIGATVLYRQKRVGLNNSVFEVLKFRSMIEDAEKDGIAKWAEKDDKRITRVGSVMRKYRIDELPQIFNALRGEMRFVGPRPERPGFVEELSREIPYYKERHTVKPGITGWAQLCYEYGSSQQDALEKLQYDLYYVKNHNFLFDLLILLQTAEVVIWKAGAR